MTRLYTTVFVALLLFVAAASIGTSAFTTASIDRASNIDVVADDQGLLALVDGTSGPLVYLNNEQLAIDVEQGTAAGVNTDAQFVLGDTADSVAEHAFAVVNNDAESHLIIAEYAAGSDDANDDENVVFAVFDASGNSVATLSEESGAQSFDAGAGETFYVVVTIDTGHETTTVLTSSTDLSGTLSFTVDDNVAV